MDLEKLDEFLDMEKILEENEERLEDIKEWLEN